MKPLDLMPAFHRQKADDLNRMYRFSKVASWHPMAGPMTRGCGTGVLHWDSSVAHCGGWVTFMGGQLGACACGCHDADRRDPISDGRDVNFEQAWSSR